MPPVLGLIPTRCSIRDAITRRPALVNCMTTLYPKSEGSQSIPGTAYRPSGIQISSLRGIKRSIQTPRPSVQPKPEKSSRNYEDLTVPIGAEIYTRADVPGIDFWRTELLSHGLTNPTPQECHETARLYCDGTDRRDLTWAKRLVSDHKITPYTLHILGVILHHVGPSNKRLHLLGTNMLATAQDLDYAPSTLQLALSHIDSVHKHGARMPPDKDHRLTPDPPFSNALTRHQSMVRGGRDASALSLQAHLFYTKNEPSKAADMFDKAWRVGMARSPGQKGISSSPHRPPVRKPRWLFEGTCHIVHAGRLQKQGKADEAAAVLRIAALELDMPQAYAALALLVPDSDEKAEFTLKAAMGGQQSACRRLVREEWEMAADKNLPKAERKTHQLMAREWQLLAEA